jgi:NADPH:quinone reductase-like Zn-dependent oxidoreductase
MLPFGEKVAVITGGTSGIGARMGEVFVANGAKVVIAGRQFSKRTSNGRAGSYPVETRVGSCASDFEAEYNLNSGRYVMRAVVLHEYGGPEKLKFEDNVPEPQVSGSTVLIAAAAASVNPIDWKLRSGMRQKDSPLSFPAILGRDVSGIVRAVGANVKHFKAGDRVLALSNATYAELVAVNDADVAHVPDGVDLANAAAIPLISLTGDQLVRLAANVQKGQAVLITGALGSVGRAAVHTAKKIGAQVIAGVRGKELDDARSLGVSDVLAIDDDKAIENFRLVDAIVDTVGGDVAAKLIAKVRQSGSFGYAAVLPESAAAQNPTVKIARVRTQPDPSKLREFADDVRDGKFVLPIGRRMPLRDAAEAHVLGEKGGIGKILLLAPDSQH